MSLETRISRHGWRIYLSEIVDATRDSARLLAGDSAVPMVFELGERERVRCLIAPGRPGTGEPLVVPTATLPREQLEQLDRGLPAELPDARALFGPQAPAAPALMLPFVVRGELAGAIALPTAAVPSLPLRQSLESLASQVGIALESAELTAKVMRRETEAHFGALVKHSSDLIFVLGPDATVQFASPSVQHMLSYDPDELSGQRLTDHVPEGDRALVDSVIAAALSSSADASEQVQVRIRHRDGHLLEAECRVTSMLDDAAVAGTVVNLRDVTERKQFERQLTYQAFHDPITGLANRALFRDRLEHALSRRRDLGAPLAVLFLDLDDFKSVNETFGHAVGDDLLRTISGRLESALRTADTIARLGGDEFAILLEEIGDETRVTEVVERLLEVVRTPLSVDDRKVSIQCSVGIAITPRTIEVASAVDELLRDADVAMYQAKSAGGDTYRHFQPEMHADVVEQLELRAELKAAIEDGGLSLAYQPVFELMSGEIAGYEALLRWSHPSRGNIPPSVFIPIAEDSGLIVPLGRWVLQRACSDAAAFQRDCPGAQERALSVNVSARQLQRPEIVEEVRESLVASGLEPHRLVLEITESMMIDDVELMIERLSALRELGVLVAVDDFGTGYSSLNYIRRLPVNQLKIDKSFIDDVDDDDQQGKLTAAIVDIARGLDLQCVAEGIERSEQHEQLKQLGCEFGQGFLMARPMDADALLELLHEGCEPALAG
jgi:diguanylate cyclase (GGDEF)-like protein/PAS domain S-box-containing protein